MGVAPGPVAPARSPPRVSRLNESLNWGTQHLELPIKNTFIEFPHMTPPTGAAARAVQSCPPSQLDEENAGNLPLPVSPPFMTPQKEEMEDVCVVIEKTFHRVATKSEGSHLHPHDCKPCAWYHHARGCQRGADCEFCHLCPAGEIKRRKKRSIGCCARARSSEAGRTSYLNGSRFRGRRRVRPASGLAFSKRRPRAIQRGIMTLRTYSTHIRSTQQARRNAGFAALANGKRPGAPSIGFYLCDLLTGRQRCGTLLRCFRTRPCV